MPPQLRLRRHRVVPIGIALFLVILLYHITSFPDGPPPPPPPPKLVVEHFSEHHAAPAPQPPAEAPKQHKPDTDPVNQPHYEGSVPFPSPPSPPAAAAATTIPSVPVTRPTKSLHDGAPEPPREHYSFPAPYYPIPSPLLQLPAAAGKIPQIQASFPAEAAEAKQTRLQRQNAVKHAFLVSWNAYREHAMPHDELAPSTNSFKDPFGGWGATLVDALDTLWIMGLKAEFREAVDYVAAIDFTTTPMQKMRVFETVIRYLGGMLAAWDVSGHDQEFKVLLDKAIELGDVLMGVFDTPNRMPLLAWGWKQKDLAKHPRADASSVAAELGSLSMEFTRLAQITGNHSYYDAVARITDALEEMQDQTLLPGLWPIRIDASGCKKVKKMPAIKTTTTTTNAVAEATEKPTKEPTTEPTKEAAKEATKEAAKEAAKEPTKEPIKEAAKEPTKEPTKEAAKEPTEESKPAIEKASGTTTDGSGHELVFKREIPPNAGAQSTDLSDDDLAMSSMGKPGNKQPIPLVDDCEPQGLKAPFLAREEQYGLGAMIDSLYEYLLKQHLLLGGNAQYERMYIKSADAAADALLYRPRVPGDPDILLAGNVYISTINLKQRFEPESSHLACFTGGMYAMGAKTFGKAEHFEIGRKLTDGCVWAYSSMKSGIMPEGFMALPCEDRSSCSYDQEAWITALEPSEELVAVANRNRMNSHMIHPATGGLKKPPPSPALDVDPTPPLHHPAQKRSPPHYGPTKTAREYAEDLIAKEELPPGFLELTDKRYILRPEAIESVWYMHRITADQSWADKGWRMWESVIQAVSVDGDGPASAVHDVTLDPKSADWDWVNSCESFWFGGE
jgi:mannosyl-oligosaccharide alpha-1,2-mannosidase